MSIPPARPAPWPSSAWSRILGYAMLALTRIGLLPVFVLGGLVWLGVQN